jgi:hypothetical protein
MLAGSSWRWMRCLFFFANNSDPSSIEASLLSAFKCWSLHSSEFCTSSCELSKSWEEESHHAACSYTQLAHCLYVTRNTIPVNNLPILSKDRNSCRLKWTWRSVPAYSPHWYSAKLMVLASSQNVCNYRSKASSLLIPSLDRWHLPISSHRSIFCMLWHHWKYWVSSPRIWQHWECVPCWATLWNSTWKSWLGCQALWSMSK